MGVRMSELSRRSKKEFQRVIGMLERECKKELTDYFKMRLELWFDSGEKSITEKQMEKVKSVLDHQYEIINNLKLTASMPEIRIYEGITDEGYNGRPNFLKLLSSKKGLELIEKILKEGEEK